MSAQDIAPEHQIVVDALAAMFRIATDDTLDDSAKMRQAHHVFSQVQKDWQNMSAQDRVRIMRAALQRARLQEQTESVEGSS